MPEADPKPVVPEGTTLATEAIDNGQATAKGNQTEGVAGTAGTQEGLKLEGFSTEEMGKLARFKSQNEIAKSYLELEKHLGVPKERLLVLPGEKASAEERVALYKKLGRPESEAEYELETIYLPDGVTTVDMGNAEFRKVALAANLTKEQAKALHKFSATEAVNQFVRMKAEIDRRRAEVDKALRAEHGTSYESKKASIPVSYQRYDRQTELTQFLNEGPGNDPRLVRYLMWVGSQFVEDRPTRGGVPGETKEQKPGQLDYSTVSPELTETRIGKR